MPYDLGDTVGIGVTVRDAASAPTNATTITLTVTLPDGTTANPAVANPPSVMGEYGVDYVPTIPGHYRWRLVTTGPTTALTGSFDVWPPDSASIVSLAEVKKHLGKSIDDTSDDEELRGFIEATTAVIEEHRGEVVVRRPVVEDMNVTCPVLAVQLGSFPVQSLTSVATVDGATTWDVNNLHVSSGGVVTVLSGPALRGMLRFTSVVGYTVIPPNYTLAAKIIVAHLWETQQQPGLGPSGPFGSEPQFLTPTGRGFAIPNRAVELLGRRPPLVA